MLKPLSLPAALDPQAAEFRLEHQGSLILETSSDRALTTPGRQGQEVDGGDFLVVSPYTFPSHLLDLRTLHTSQQLLAKALTILQHVRADYATAPYAESFNWDAVVSNLKAMTEHSGYFWNEQHFYIVVFRSQIPPTTDRRELGRLDEHAHAEAMKSGGLLKYWFGLPDANGRNLATCVWRKQEDARPGSTGTGHKAAIRATTSMYTEWHIERLKFSINDAAKDWSILPWED